MVQPPCVPHFGNPIADERQSRCAQRNQFVRVHRQVAGILASERSLGRAVLQKITCHPVIPAGPVRFSTSSPKLRLCGLTPPSPEEPTSTAAKRVSNAMVTSAAFP